MQSKLSISEFTIVWSIWMTEEYDRTRKDNHIPDNQLIPDGHGHPPPHLTHRRHLDGYLLKLQKMLI